MLKEPCKRALKIMDDTDTDMLPGVTLGTTLSVRGLGPVVLDQRVKVPGGYGVVFKGVCERDGRPVAVKFMRGDESCGTEEQKKAVARFNREVKTLRDFRDEESFPEFLVSGKFRDIPFYVMEWLLPANPFSIDTNDKRYKYVMDICYAVSTLHREGYVHYDIKPSNIMMREKTDGGIQYVLVDFGSVHRVEKSGGNRCPCRSVSQLSDGRRVYPHTPGYADPLETLHTVNADIYAIGQVIRDTFAESVSPEWAVIIDRCTSRNRAYRYPDVESILCDLDRLKTARYALDTIEDRAIWLAQKTVLDEKPEEMSWRDLRWRLAWQPLSSDEEYPPTPGVFSPASELLIDFGRLGCRNIYIKEPVHMTSYGLLVIRGNGKISIELDGNGQTDYDDFDEDSSRWDEPVYPFVILLDGATLENRTRLDNEDAQLMYMVGRYCLLNFRFRSASALAVDSRYILTGRAGYSFVRNGSQVGDRGLYGVLSDGGRNLFAQQKWDELDIRGILEVLRRVRPWQRQGLVQDWLERNVESVLMRNMGRFDI